MNNNGIYLEKWNNCEDKVELIYKDGSILYVSKEDFNRAFGPIVSASKEDVERDFAIK